MFGHDRTAAREHCSTVFVQNLDTKTFVGFFDPDIFCQFLQIGRAFNCLAQLFFGFLEFLVFLFGKTLFGYFFRGFYRRDIHAYRWCTRFRAQRSLFGKALPAKNPARTGLAL